MRVVTVEGIKAIVAPLFGIERAHLRGKDPVNAFLHETEQSLPLPSIYRDMGTIVPKFR